jgi:type IV pilus assembly protein PilM
MAIKIDSFFKKLFKKTDRSVVGIDIGASSIKVVQLQKKKGRAVLETYGELALGPYIGKEVGVATSLPPDKLAEAITDLFKEANITTISSGISIPMRQSMVAVLKFPETDKKKLSLMVPLEARKYIPVAISEVTLDWFTIPSVKRGDEGEVLSTEVLAVAIHNDVLSTYSSIVNAANLNTTFFEVEMFSAIRSIVDVQEVKPILILDIGAGSTKLYIVERGIIRQSHVVNKGGQNITLNLSRALNVSVEYAEDIKRNRGNNTPDQEKTIDEIVDIVLNPVFAEVNSAILSYQKKEGKTIEKMIIVGGGALLGGVLEKAQEKFRVPVELGNPFEKTEAPAFLIDILKETGPAFASSIGVALRKLQEID